MEDKRNAESASLGGVSGSETKRARVATRPVSLDDVAEFQKEAIFRAMESYRREKEVLEKQLETQTDKERDLEERVVRLGTWWDKVADRLAVVVGKYQFEKPSQVKSEKKEDEEDKEDEEEKEDEDKEVTSKPPTGLASDLELEEKSSTISAHFSTLLDLISDKIQKQDKTETARLSAGYTDMAEQRHLLVQKIQDLESQANTMKNQYLAAAKKLDRFKSSTVKLIEGEDAVEESSEENGEKTEDKNAVKSESEEKPEETGDSKALKETVELQEKQMAELDAKIASLEHDASLFSAKMADLSESDLLEHSGAFKAIKEQLSDKTSQISALEKSRDAISAEKTALDENRQQYRSAVKREFEKRESELRNQLSRAETDLVRIRTARDEILADLSQKKATENDKLKTIESLKELGEVYKQRIGTLESEVKRWRKEESKEEDKSSGENIVDKSLEELQKEVKVLNMTNQSLMAEIPGMEAAFVSASKLAENKTLDVSDRESKLTKLLAEKAKADEKYFAAMRHKDALGAENAKLKAQMVKSSELVNQLQEVDAKTRAKIDVLEKTLSDYVSLHAKQQEAAKRLTSQVAEKTHMLNGAQKYLSTLKEEMKQQGTKLSVGEHRARKLALDNAKLSKQVELKSFGGSSDEIDELRSIAMCSVCSKNWKDTALKVCGHVFCHQCAQDRLDARLRKCPNCNKPFSQNDLLTVHL
ncbi:E3 ubiquitin-protein ligase BRE1 [Yarrowia sp. C11]|nr:E3 ubiquitin-protein ligase BRE1 [Yarrowia sp. E02]KAG5372916.1 E3 ubiquitin-protein ligase BRE1 [Yarrowia sp. C11]